VRDTGREPRAGRDPAEGVAEGGEKGRGEELQARIAAPVPRVCLRMQRAAAEHHIKIMGPTLDLQCHRDFAR
jgi:hypothetical protein